MNICTQKITTIIFALLTVVTMSVSLIVYAYETPAFHIYLSSGIESTTTGTTTGLWKGFECNNFTTSSQNARADVFANNGSGYRIDRTIIVAPGDSSGAEVTNTYSTPCLWYLKLSASHNIFQRPDVDAETYLWLVQN